MYNQSESRQPAIRSEMEHTQQLLREAHEAAPDTTDLTRAAEEKANELVADLRTETWYGHTPTPEQRFEHDVGEMADEAAECLDDMCTVGALGASGESQEH